MVFCYLLKWCSVTYDCLLLLFVIMVFCLLLLFVIMAVCDYGVSIVVCCLFLWLLLWLFVV